MNKMIKMTNKGIKKTYYYSFIFSYKHINSKINIKDKYNFFNTV